MFKVMTRGSFRRLTRKIEREAYDEGYERGRAELADYEKYLAALRTLLEEKERQLEKVSKDKLLEILKDVVIPNLNVGIEEGIRLLDYEIEDEADKAIEARKQEEVPSAEG